MLHIWWKLKSVTDSLSALHGDPGKQTSLLPEHPSFQFTAKTTGAGQGCTFSWNLSFPLELSDPEPLLPKLLQSRWCRDPDRLLILSFPAPLHSLYFGYPRAWQIFARYHYLLPTLSLWNSRIPRMLGTKDSLAITQGWETQAPLSVWDFVWALPAT